MNPERFRKLRRTLDRRQWDLTVVMDRVHKPHNLSAILRNADAVGVLEVHAVPMEGRISVPHQTSAGSARWVDVRTHGSAEEAIGFLQERRFQVLAAHPSPEAWDYREVDLTRPTAFLVGQELKGLDRTARERVDGHVSIPMVGMVSSLNVSVATSLLLYEAFRQRERRGYYRTRRLPEDLYRARLFEWAYPEAARRLKAAGKPYPELTEDGTIDSGSGESIPVMG